MNSNTLISGLRYIDDWINKEEANELYNILSTLNWISVGNSKNSRVAAHYGYYYNYDRSGLTKAPPIPERLLEILIPQSKFDFNNIHIDRSRFNQLIINQYLPGQKIAPHIDHTKYFDDIIVCITLMNDDAVIPIIFQKYFNNTTEQRLVNAKNRSMYLMSGDARWNWKHSLINKSNTVRWSFTFREVVNH